MAELIQPGAVIRCVIPHANIEAVNPPSDAASLRPRFDGSQRANHRFPKGMHTPMATKKDIFKEVRRRKSVPCLVDSYEAAPRDLQTIEQIQRDSEELAIQEIS